MDFDTFYATDGPTLFVDKMAIFLGIPNDKMRVVSIVKGSVKIKYEVVLDDETAKSSKMAALTKSVASNATDAVTDACGGGGITKGIADALSSGELDFGGEVSEISYRCNKPVTNTSAFN